MWRRVHEILEIHEVVIYCNLSSPKSNIKVVRFFTFKFVRR